MIKDVVVALLTVTISNYSNKCTDGNLLAEIDNILDYVADLPTDGQAPVTIVLSNQKEVDTLRKRIRELEEACEYDNEVVGKQFRKIQEQREEIMAYSKACNKLIGDKNE